MASKPPLVRVRRLPNTGLLGRRREFEVEVTDGGPSPVRTRTRSPYGVLRDIVGWDEAALLEQRASRAWDGGVGFWVTAFTGTVENSP